jgi:hypothetical protein
MPSLPTPEAFLADLEHPFKTELEAMRRIFLNASPEIQEGFKWNSLSFRTTEWFATFNWREKKQLQFVMHLGAKVQDKEIADIPDPAHLLKWLSKDRCLLNLPDADTIAANREALTSLVQAWITHV